MTSKGDAGRWREGAACRHVDPETFFPVGTAGPALLEIGRAREICAVCPVRTRCLNWALQHGAAFGIWGGLTEDERRAIRRQGSGSPNHAADDSQEEASRWMTG